MTPSPRLRLVVLAWALLSAFAQVGASAGEPASPLNEYAVKAAFIFNFAKFVEWPAKATGKVKLCLVGADPFDGALAGFENRPLGDKRFVSRRLHLQSDEELLGCDILFIARSEQDRLTSLLQAVKDLPILTVGDGEGYARLGVMINFYLDQGKVRFEINSHAPRRAGLQLSAKLMQLGRPVEGLE